MNLRRFLGLTLFALFALPSPASARGEGELIGSLLISMLVLGIVFLILREVVCWYYKQNQVVGLLVEIRNLLRQQVNESSGTARKGSPDVRGDETSISDSRTSGVDTTNKDSCLSCGHLSGSGIEAFSGTTVGRICLHHVEDAKFTKFCVVCGNKIGFLAVQKMMRFVHSNQIVGLAVHETCVAGFAEKVSAGEVESWVEKHGAF